MGTKLHNSGITERSAPGVIAKNLIESSPAFNYGFLSGSMGYPWDHNILDDAKSLNYERGRHFAALGWELTLENLTKAMEQLYVR